MSVPQITLYDHPVSSYAQKIRILLREKSLPFKMIHRGTPGFDLDHFNKISPRGEVPCLEHAGAAIFDSTIIAEYLEDAFPHAPSMFPPREDPAARAKVRMIEDVADTAYEAINWGWGETSWFGRAGDAGSPLYEHLKTEAKRQTAEMQAWLETQLGDHEYFGGQSGFGIADAVVATVVNRSQYYGFPPAKGSKLEAWFNKIRQRPSVQETFKEFEDAVDMMPKMKEVFQSGKALRQYRDFRLEWMVKSGAIQVIHEGMDKKNIKFNWPDGKRGDSSDGSKI